MSDLTSKRPYLIRALHEWMTDNGETPLIVVDASNEGLRAPGEYVEQGKLILNVSYSATGSLLLGNDAISFSARFNGQPMELYVPVDAVLGIYGRESGEGMIFAASEDAYDGEAALEAVPAADTSVEEVTSPSPSKPRPTLKVVK